MLTYEDRAIHFSIKKSLACVYYTYVKLSVCLYDVDRCSCCCTTYTYEIIRREGHKLNCSRSSSSITTLTKELRTKQARKNKKESKRSSCDYLQCSMDETNERTCEGAKKKKKQHQIFSHIVLLKSGQRIKSLRVWKIGSS